MASVVVLVSFELKPQQRAINYHKNGHNDMAAWQTRGTVKMVVFLLVPLCTKAKRAHTTLVILCHQSLRATPLLGSGIKGIQVE